MMDHIPLSHIPRKWLELARCPVCSATELRILAQEDVAEQMMCSKCGTSFEISATNHTFFRLKALPRQLKFLSEQMLDQWLLVSDIRQAIRQNLAKMQEHHEPSSAIRNMKALVSGKPEMLATHPTPPPPPPVEIRKPILEPVYAEAPPLTEPDEPEPPAQDESLEEIPVDTPTENVVSISSPGQDIKAEDNVEPGQDTEYEPEAEEEYRTEIIADAGQEIEEAAGYYAEPEPGIEQEQEPREIYQPAAVARAIDNASGQPGLEWMESTPKMSNRDVLDRAKELLAMETPKAEVYKTLVRAGAQPQQAKDALAYLEQKKRQQEAQAARTLGIVLAIIAGILLIFIVVAGVLLLT